MLLCPPESIAPGGNQGKSRAAEYILVPCSNVIFFAPVVKKGKHWLLLELPNGVLNLPLPSTFIGLLWRLSIENFKVSPGLDEILSQGGELVPLTENELLVIRGIFKG